MKSFLRNCASLVVLAGVFPAIAHAQSTPAKGAQGLEEIVVTAEKRETTAQKTSIAIDVLSGNKLAQAGVGDMSQLQAIAPGVQFGASGTASFVTVRGVSGRDATEIGDPAVAINVDGIFPRGAEGRCRRRSGGGHQRRRHLPSAPLGHERGLLRSGAH